MSLTDLFQSASRELQRRDILHAVAGGLAADLYRSEVRLTLDVDLVIYTRSNAKKIALELASSLGLKTGLVRAADLAGGPHFAVRQKTTAVCIVVGRPEGEPDGEGLDVLLPEIPWVEEAVHRAQNNQVDYGFGPVPALTLEDVMLAKLYALRALPVRAKDLDDLQSICAAGHDIDRVYLSGRMQHLGITIREPATHFLPDWLLDVSRDIERTA